MQKKAEKHFGTEKVLNLVITVLCVVLLFTILSFIKEIDEYGRAYIAPESTLINMVKYEQYYSLAENANKEEAMGTALTGEKKELYAVAHYFENAVMYQAYLTTGDTARTKKRYEQMKEYESQMGDYAFAGEEIRQKLGIEEK